MKGIYAVSGWIVSGMPPREAAALLAGAGFRMVEISGPADSALLREWSMDCEAVTGAFASSGVSVSSFHCSEAGQLGFDSPDTGAREACISANMDSLMEMKRCSVPCMVIHPGGWEQAPCRGLAKDSLSRIAGRAGELGLRMAVENTRMAPGPESRIESVLELTEGLGGHVGVCLDVGHSALAGLDPVEELRTAADSGRLFTIHLHNVTKDGTDHLLPTEGMVDLDGVIEELDRTGFRGPRTIELRPLPEDAAGRLARAAGLFKI